jgi:hypothetical protein
MTTLLTQLGEVVTSVTSTGTDIIAVIMANPLLLLPFGIAFLGAGVGLFKRLA